MSLNVRDTATESHEDLVVTERLEETTEFVSTVVDDAGADGVVVALSGGIDSSTAATLAVRALGPESVYGLVLPSAATDRDNMKDAQQLAFSLDINFRTVDVQPLVDWFESAVVYGYGERFGNPPTTQPRFSAADPIDEPVSYKRHLGNAVARLRMAMAYFEANSRNRLVLGTGNRTELLLGYFTKFGDGGVDLLPLGDYYKTEVRELARALEVPEPIVEKQPTAGLWEGQTDEAELGARYPTVDAVLRRLVDDGMGVDAVVEAVDADREVVEDVAEMYRTSVHKRTPPPRPSTYASQVDGA